MQKHKRHLWQYANIGSLALFFSEKTIRKLGKFIINLSKKNIELLKAKNIEKNNPIN